MIQTGPDSVVCYWGDPLRETASVRIDKDPDYLLFSRDGRTLYVLHRGWDGKLQTNRFDGPKPAQLSVINLSSLSVTRKIPLGTGVRTLYEADNGTLFSGAQGRWRVSRYKLGPEEKARIIAVGADAENAVLEHRLEDLAQDFAITRDGQRVFSFSGGQQYGTDSEAVLAGLTLGILGRVRPKAVDQQLYVFGAEKAEALMSISLGNHVDAMGFSGDQKKLFVLGRRLGDPGKAAKKQQAESILQVVDVESGQVGTERVLGSGVRKLVPVGTHYLIAGGEELRVLSFDGNLGEPQPLGEGRSGFPAELVRLPDGRAIAFLEDEKGKPTNRVISFDMGSGRVTSAAVLGRGSLRRAVGAQFTWPKIRSTLIRSAILSMLQYGSYQAGGGSTFYYFVPVPTGLHPPSLAPSVDSSYVFALAANSNEVTVLRAGDLELAGRLPVPEDTFQLWAPKGSKRLFALSGDRVTVFDTETLKETGVFKYTGGEARAIEVGSKGSRLYVLSGKALDIFDEDHTKPISSLNDLKSARTVAVWDP